MNIEQSVVDRAVVVHDLSLREIESRLYSVHISDKERSALEVEYMERLENREMELVNTLWS